MSERVRRIYNGYDKSKAKSKEKQTNETLHPDYYNAHPSGVECITIIQEFSYNIGAAVKYLWRQGLKPNENSIKELRKAKNYIEFEIARLESLEAEKIDKK